jgi:HD-like signal output (HDOD) protein
MTTLPIESPDRTFLLDKLPVFPTVALELIDLLESSIVDADQIVHLLGRDPALSAEVLQHANSARFARRRSVGELSEAVTVLGTDLTSRIAMSAACRGLVAPALGRPELRRCWEHSLASAILADKFAPLLDQAPRAAYTAGLLHDIGCLALLAVYPDRYVEALTLTRTSAMRWLEAERSVFGVDHCAVGRWVVDDWRLPDDLREVVIHHHDDRPFDRSMVTLVAIATLVADLLLPHPIQNLPWQTPEAYLATLPLELGRTVEAVEDAAQRIWEELAA